MSINSWLQNLLSALAPGQSERKLARRGSLRAATHRLNLEPLEDRRLLAFSTPVDYTVGLFPSDVKAGDFNGDAILDLATANRGSGSVSVLLGNAEGTFQPARDTPASWYPLSVAVGDFDEDGKLDLATANYYVPGQDGLTVLLGNGDGTFTYAPPVEGLEWADSIATGDLNADGKLDLVTTSLNYSLSYGYFSYVSVMIGHGDGTFASHYVHFEGYFTSLTLADLDGDSDDDVVVGDYDAKVFLSNGDGTLQAPRDVGVVDGFAVADLDADGILDLVTTSRYSNGVSVLRGHGDGTFEPAQFFAAGASPDSVDVADVDGDSVLDLVLINRVFTEPGPDGLTVLLGDGTGSFGPPITTTPGSDLGALVVDDFNADGRPDTAVTRFGNKVSVLTNDGAWSSDDPPSVNIGDATVSEGNTGTVNATFMVTLSPASAVAVTFSYATADISAAAGNDYTAASGTVTIPAGQTSATCTVAVKGDRLGEPNETLAVNLSAATNATIGDGQAIGTILDNEPRVSISDVSKSEGKNGKTTLFTFTVTLSAAYDQPVTMSFKTVNGTATTGNSDYIAKTGTLTFGPGERVKTITIEVKGDSKKEANETFYLDLFGLSTNALFTKNRGIGTILNDD